MGNKSAVSRAPSQLRRILWGISGLLEPRAAPVNSRDLCWGKAGTRNSPTTGRHPLQAGISLANGIFTFIEILQRKSLISITFLMGKSQNKVLLSRFDKEKTIISLADSIQFFNFLQDSDVLTIWRQRTKIILNIYSTFLATGPFYSGKGKPFSFSLLFNLRVFCRTKIPLLWLICCANWMNNFSSCIFLTSCLLWLVTSHSVGYLSCHWSHFGFLSTPRTEDKLFKQQNYEQQPKKCK